MTELAIVHLSDLHFGGSGPGLAPDRALSLAMNRVADDFAKCSLIVAITGDVTLRGGLVGLQDAGRSIDQHIRKLLPDAKILVCPGNHDITDGDDFSDFNRFTWSATHDSSQVFTRKSPVAVTTSNGIDYVLVNSASCGDHKFGRVPLDQLSDALNRVATPLILVHHNPIAGRASTSAIQNAYEFLALASQPKVVGILHGHVHAEQVLLVGRRPTFLTGVGSLGFPPEPNMNNQFAVYQMDGTHLLRAWSYRFAKDRDDFVRVEVPHV